MREILFRGKREDNGEWVEGNLFVPDKPNTPTQICIGTNVIRIAFDIFPKTIGQYTGLTDKNDKRIFEGDILEFHTQSDILVNLCVVNWDDRDACWTLKMETMSPRFFMHDPKAVEIIGNIHDNPELLEGMK